MKKLLQAGLFAITLAIFFSPKVLVAENSLENNFSSLACNRDGDKNKGHGNDPYVDFTMNIEEIGVARISGDFDLDNPGTSLDKQMEILVEGEKIQWSTLNGVQKQQIKDEWANQICLLSLYPD